MPTFYHRPAPATNTNTPKREKRERERESGSVFGLVIVRAWAFDVGGVGLEHAREEHAANYIELLREFGLVGCCASARALSLAFKL